MAKAAGFRNLLVHQYGEIDDNAVVASLGRLQDLQEFVRAVLEWVKAGVQHDAS
ncbi:HepT-like ribonuclease domain-containing protein [Phytoactinopolyspora halotolerans]|uniref:DUF86 domain-containing protein n=1 Tax=Phytoactinopolyspora halotolerans TaxID=1981512 RepID=A0A6L9S410_9ACTN|nr:DUF86 domain-containing protein [Phytoactinopolyspora halotolerans]